MSQCDMDEAPDQAMERARRQSRWILAITVVTVLVTGGVIFAVLLSV
ncbi:MAG: hypothetical protein AAF715_17110 [Myxococcota bacterium]